ncbi:MAG: DNA polymerase III subunit beta [Legionellales bacterium RIFCSPHIGHO2_12_FULL_37_14]|nr:MAG: DNA polymerase III subunit beta [Legionellales bacterium RIFCSPHIGHO2_12_FULL_37_14]
MTKLSFAKKQWQPAIQIVANAVDKKQLLPALSSILVRSVAGKLTLTATDLEIELTAFLPFTEDLVDPFMLPAKKFGDILRTMDDDAVVTVEVQKDALYINSGLSKFKFTPIAMENFPFIEAPPWQQSFDVPKEILTELIDSTIFAVSQQDTRIFLNGLLFEGDKDSLTTVGADGHRMAIASREIALLTDKERQILPRKAAQELLRLLNLVDCESIRINLGAALFQAETADFIFTSKLVDAQYLPYQQAIPKKSNLFVLADVEALKRALTRILIIAEDKSRPLVFDIQGGNLVLLAQNSEQEEVKENVEATIDGPDLRIGLNPLYLLEALNAIKTSVVRLAFYNADTPILVEPFDDKFYQYIIMPMKI